MSLPNSKLDLKPNERAFTLLPMGIKYICEHCNEGEMRHVLEDVVNDPLVMGMPRMYKHRCDKCQGELSLPKVYPYIEWLPGPVWGGTGKYLDENGLAHAVRELLRLCDDKYVKKPGPNGYTVLDEN